MVISAVKYIKGGVLMLIKDELKPYVKDYDKLRINGSELDFECAVVEIEKLLVNLVVTTIYPSQLGSYRKFF